jgi:tetratricopeptide (TPR) repeat protein
MSVPPALTPTPSPPRVRRLPRLALLLAALAAGALVLVGGGFRLQHRFERQNALALARSGDFRQAAPALRQALRRDPRDLEVIQALARGSLDAEDRPRAEEYLTAWCALRPDDPEPRRLRMQAYARDERHEDALADARWLLQKEPDSPDARRQVASLLFSLGRFDEAEREYRAVLAQRPDDPNVLLLLAEVRRAQGAGADAAALADQVLRQDPQSPRALMLRGILYREAGEPERAVEVLRRVVATDPTRRRTATYELSLALERAGRTEEARQAMAEVRRLQDSEVLQTASETQPENLALKVQAAEALLQSGETQRALDLLDQALERDPSYAPAHRLLADYFERQGDLRRAAQHRRAAQAP